MSVKSLTSVGIVGLSVRSVYDPLNPCGAFAKLKFPFPSVFKIWLADPSLIPKSVNV